MPQKSRKINLIRCLSYRAVIICRDCKIENEFKVIKYIFIDKGYPEEVIDVNIQYTVTRLKNTNKTFGPPKCPVYFRLPSVGSVSQSFAEKIASSVYCCYHAQIKDQTRCEYWSLFNTKTNIHNESGL